MSNDPTGPGIGCDRTNLDKRSVRTGHNTSKSLRAKTNGGQPTAQLTWRLIEQAARHSSEGVISFDCGGDCLGINQAAAQMLRLDDASWLVGRLNLRRHSIADRQRERLKIERAFLGEAVELPEFHYDFCFEGPSDRESTRSLGSTKLIPLVEANGRTSVLYAFHQPGAEWGGHGPGAEADSQEALLDHGIATARLATRRITHDFNNLISVVQGYTTILQGRPHLDPESQELVSLIAQAGSQLAGTTDRLARFVDSPSQDRARLNLNQVVMAFIDQPGSEVPESIELRVDLGDQMPDLIGDEGGLNEVCSNLRQNAIESMPHGGILSWETSSLWIHHPSWMQPSAVGQSHYLRLRVSDTGQGMDAETRANLFVPFFTTKSGKGRGLGATAIYETVKSHGGYVGVSSNPGGGTRVDLYFPTANDAENQPDPDSGSADAPSGPLLLIVDDDDMVRMAIQRMLAHLGYRSLAAANGEEALDIYQGSGAEIDAVILDITMPGAGGVETFHRLREIDNQVKVIVSSGDPMNPAIREIEAHGISYMIPKPFRTEQLARAIQQTLT